MTLRRILHRSDREFVLTIRMENAAFDPDPQWEVARILRDVVEKIDRGRTDGPILDINGNTVGKFEMKGGS